jgi:hypothetical protein
MAFTRDNFGPIGNVSKAGNAPIMWGYKTADAIADVNTEGYFNGVADIVTVGDLVYCVTSTGSTAVATLAVVRSNTGTVVDIDNGTTLADTDGD